MSPLSAIGRLLGTSTPRNFRDISVRDESRPIQVEGRTPTVVCIHGFTGVPHEVALAVDVAKMLGLRARAPLLAGHGTNPGALSKTRFSDWLSSARPTFDEARSRGPVILVGQSLGSLIATELTLSAPRDVIGLVIMANAFWLSGPHPALSLRVARRLGLPDFFVTKHGPDLGDPETYRTHVTYDAQSSHAAMSLEQAGRRLRNELGAITCPTLILHGARDKVCPVDNAWKVAERLGTRDARVVIFPRSHHILPRDVEREQVAAEIETFLRRLSL